MRAALRSGGVWTRVSRTLVLVALSLACAATPVPALAGDAGFDRFCDKWMGKLAKRERANANKVRIVRRGEWFVGEFVGYSKRPKKCKAIATGSSANPYVGRIVYEEIQYQHAGLTQREAQKSAAKPRGRTEVTEIFRYDGSAWVY